VCPSSCQPCANAFSNALSLELRDCSEDMQLQAAGGRCCVDPFIQGDEPDTHSGELVEQ
jgi:hypothetical protein